MKPLDDFDKLIAMMRDLVLTLEDENRHLRKENGELWDAIHKLQDEKNEVAA